jgi:uncharacterized membrane protein YkvA (DUF1232 family)
LARRAKRDAAFLWLAARDRRTPLAAKAICGLAAAYVLSPVQLLPDFIPVVGYLDDIAVVALAGWLALRMIPPELVREFRAKARTIASQPISILGVLAIIAVWVGLTVLISLVFLRVFARHR